MHNIHLVGMGMLGCAIAWTLDKNGYDFTWEDKDAPYTAWKASTGLIYPSGDETDMQAYATWKRWADGNAPWQDKIKNITEKCSYWFLSKKPPHGGKYAISNVYGTLHLASLPSFHLNVQNFVLKTRTYFAKKKTKPFSGETITIYAHGFTKERLNHVVWGWTAFVEAIIDPSFLQCSPHRPMFYIRKGRYQLGYMNPIPGSHCYYAGSSLIVQKEAHPLAIQPKAEKWKTYIEKETEGIIRIKKIGEMREGWRPASAKEDLTWTTRKDSNIFIRPLWSSGVRHAPHITQAALQTLGEIENE